MVDLTTCAYSVLFRRSFPVPMDSRLFSKSSSIRISVPDLMLISLIHLQWSFVQAGWQVWKYLHSFTHNQFDQQHLLKFFFFFQCIYNEVFIGVWTYVDLQFDCINQCVYFFVPIPCCFYYYSSVVKFGYVLFIIHNWFNYPVFFYVSIWSWKLSRSVKNCVEILIRIALNLYFLNYRMAIFAILILLIHEHKKSFLFQIAS